MQVCEYDNYPYTKSGTVEMQMYLRALFSFYEIMQWTMDAIIPNRSLSSSLFEQSTLLHLQ